MGSVTVETSATSNETEKTQDRETLHSTKKRKESTKKIVTKQQSKKQKEKTITATPLTPKPGKQTKCTIHHEQYAEGITYY